MKQKTKVLGLCVIAILFLLYFLRTAISNNTTWKVDNTISIVVVVLVYLVYKKLNMQVTTIALLLFALLLHNAGVFGLYSNTYFQLSYDHYTHFFGALALFFMFYDYTGLFTQKYRTRAFCAFMMALGVSAIHEVVEFLGYTYFARGDGVFFFGTGDIGDSGTYGNSMTDIIYNMIGAMFGVVVKKLFKS